MLAISIWFVTSPSTFSNSRREIARYPIVLILAGSILGTAMTIALISRTYQLFDKNHNLIIDELGIYNNVSFATSTFIKWDSIKSINVKKIRLTKFLKIYSNTPMQITDKGNWTNTFIKAKQKNQYVATLTADTLKIKFEDLEKLVRDGWEESKIEIKKKIPIG